MKKSIFDSIKKNNEKIEVQNEKGIITLKKCWNDDSFYFTFKSIIAMSFLKNIVFRKELFGIYHTDKKLYEFIYAPLQEEFNRSFNYIYEGKQYKLYYGEPSLEFQKLVKHFSINEDAEMLSDRYVGLSRFYYYYQEKKKSMIPTNFFIEGDFCDDYNDHLAFFKHVNLMMTFYDRRSPYIAIFDTTEDEVSDDIKVPCNLDVQPFPQIINTKQLNSTLLELIEAARSSNSYRMKYIFYYQILEYCSYYYIENDLKRKLTNIVKTPDILNSDKYSSKIIELYSDYFKRNNDVQRMEKLLSDLCTYDDIRNELEKNSKYFVEKTCFDGGLVIDGLFNKPEDIDNPPKGIMVSVRKNIDIIRNVLVHARESRENVVIKPTHRNSFLLRPYLYLLRRIAEIVVIKFEE